MQSLTGKVRETSSLVSSEKTNSNFTFTFSIRSICLILRGLNFLISTAEIMVRLRAFGPSLKAWPPLGQVTTHMMVPKDSAAPVPTDYLVVLFIKCFDRLVYWELSNGKAFEGWMLVRHYYTKSTSENQTSWLQRGLVGVN